MATLTAWASPRYGDADAMVDKLKALQSQQLINIQDAAVVWWEVGKKKPKTRQLNNLAGLWRSAAPSGGCCSGLLFFVPLLGAAIGAGVGALTGSMSDVGIDDKFIDGVKQRVTPGTSALFLLTSDVVEDRVKGELSGTKAELIASNLTEDQEARLREVFGED